MGGPTSVSARLALKLNYIVLDDVQLYKRMPRGKQLVSARGEVVAFNFNKIRSPVNVLLETKHLQVRDVLYRVVG